MKRQHILGLCGVLMMGFSTQAFSQDKVNMSHELPITGQDNKIVYHIEDYSVPEGTIKTALVSTFLPDLLEANTHHPLPQKPDALQGEVSENFWQSKKTGPDRVQSMLPDAVRRDEISRYASYKTTKIVLNNSNPGSIRGNIVSVVNVDDKSPYVSIQYIFNRTLKNKADHALAGDATITIGDSLVVVDKVGNGDDRLIIITPDFVENK